jgi:acyl-coenzyme A synthetase/AMP-(fatty) acid ligase
MAYIYDCDVKEMAWKALELSKYKPPVVIAVDYAGTKPRLPAGHVLYEDFIKGASDENPAPDAPADMYDEVTRLYTSGTTGLPKGIPLNNINEVLSAHDVMMHFPLNPHDVTMNMTPWFHRGGLHSGGLTPTFYAGASLVVLRSFNAKTCLEYAGKYGVTFLIGVPAVLGNLATRQEKHPEDLSTLKGIVTMGSPWRKGLHPVRTCSRPIFSKATAPRDLLEQLFKAHDLPRMAGNGGVAPTTK